jgi:hypothetical protein
MRCRGTHFGSRSYLVALTPSRRNVRDRRNVREPVVPVLCRRRVHRGSVASSRARSVPCLAEGADRAAISRYAEARNGASGSGAESLIQPAYYAGQRNRRVTFLKGKSQFTGPVQWFTLLGRSSKPKSVVTEHIEHDEGSVREDDHLWAGCRNPCHRPRKSGALQTACRVRSRGGRQGLR